MLHWEASGVPLPTYVEYVPVTLPFKLSSGNLDVKIDLSYVGRGREPAQLTVAGTTRLADLVLTDRAEKPLLSVPSLAVALDRLDIMGGRAEVRSIAADGIVLELVRTPTGELNLARLVPAKTPSNPGSPFRFRVGSIAVSHGTVHIADQAIAPAFVATLTDVAVDVANLDNAGGKQATVALSFATDLGARVTHRGKLGMNPLVADGRLEITGLKLGRLFPYYASALNVVVDDGALDVQSDVRYGGPDAAAGLALSNLGATLSELKLRLPGEKEPLWRVPKLGVGNGAVDVAKRTGILTRSRGTARRRSSAVRPTERSILIGSSARRKGAPPRKAAAKGGTSRQARSRWTISPRHSSMRP